MCVRICNQNVMVLFLLHTCESLLKMEAILAELKGSTSYQYHSYIALHTCLLNVNRAEKTGRGDIGESGRVGCRH